MYLSLVVINCRLSARCDQWSCDGFHIAPACGSASSLRSGYRTAARCNAEQTEMYHYGLGGMGIQPVVLVNLRPRLETASKKEAW